MKLDQIVTNPRHRKWVYRVFAAVGLILGAAQVAFASLGLDAPALLTASFAVYGFLAAAGFTVSQANTVEPTGSIEGVEPVNPFDE